MHALLRFALAAASTALLTAVPAAAQRRLLFDARTPSRTGRATAAEVALLEREIRPAASRMWDEPPGQVGLDRNVCRGAINVRDVAAGSFTRRGAAQRAILYEWCQTAAIFAKGGVVVVERGRIAAHAVYNDDVPNGIHRAPDVTGDGRDELVFEVDGHTVMGHSELYVYLLSLTPGRADGYSFVTRVDDCGKEDPRALDTVFLTYAVPGRPLRFVQQRYEKPCNEAARFVRQSREITPDVLRAGFRRLR